MNNLKIHINENVEKMIEMKVEWKCTIVKFDMDLNLKCEKLMKDERKITYVQKFYICTKCLWRLSELYS